MSKVGSITKVKSITPGQKSKTIIGHIFVPHIDMHISILWKFEGPACHLSVHAHSF